MTEHYVRQDGAYIGGFSGAAPLDVGAINIGDNPPADARQIWQFPGWSEIPVSIDSRRAEILAELMAIDAASARPLRAILVGGATDEDRARLAELDEQAAALRVELVALEAPPSE